MIFYNDPDFGADIDGNRGTDMWIYELEPSDISWIRPQIDKYLEGTEAPEPFLDVEWYNPITGEIVTLNINIQDWI